MLSRNTESIYKHANYSQLEFRNGKKVKKEILMTFWNQMILI